MCGPVTNDNKHYPLDNQPLQPQLGQIFFLVSVKYFLVLILILGWGWWCPQLMFMYCQCYRQSPWRWSWIMTPVSPWSPENCCHHTPALLSWLLIFRHRNAELRCQYLLRPVCPRSVSGRDCPMVTSVSPAPWLELLLAPDQHDSLKSLINRTTSQLIFLQMLHKTEWKKRRCLSAVFCMV